MNQTDAVYVWAWPFAEPVLQWRRSRGISQEVMAEMLGISERTIRRVERQQKLFLTFRNADRIATLVDRRDLLETTLTLHQMACVSSMFSSRWEYQR